MMPTDDERREVARRLREHSGAHLFTGEDVERLIEVKPSDFRPVDADMNYNRLADLIEPSEPKVECVPGECPLNVRHDNDRIDLERLLAIATMMAADSVRSVKQGSSVSPVYILHAARNIAEACGETFSSIRNRELAEWGTSIVPEETIVDRDALLALADELESEGLEAWASGPANVGEFARRIREAVGA